METPPARARFAARPDPASLGPLPSPKVKRPYGRPRLPQEARPHPRNWRRPSGGPLIESYGWSQLATASSFTRRGIEGAMQEEIPVPGFQAPEEFEAFLHARMGSKWTICPHKTQRSLMVLRRGGDGALVELRFCPPRVAEGVPIHGRPRLDRRRLGH